MAGPGRPWPVSGNASILRDKVPSVPGPSDPDSTEARTVAIGIADTGRTDMDPTKLEVGGPDPDQKNAGLEDTDSSDVCNAGSTCVEHADDGSAARDTDPAQIDPVDPDPAAGLGTDPADGPGSGSSIATSSGYTTSCITVHATAATTATARASV